MHVEFRTVAPVAPVAPVARRSAGRPSAFARRAALCASFFAACACADPGNLPALANERAPVVNGEVSPRGGIEDAVLLLHTTVDGAELICSSSLVAPNLVLTARHCVSHLVQGLFTCTAQGELVSEDAAAGTLGRQLPADSLEFFSGKVPRTTPAAYGQEVISTLSETICVNDLAFVVLDRPLDLPVLPLRLGGRAERGEPVTLVGYGLDDAMSQTESLDVATQPRTHNDTLVVADVGLDVADDSVFSTAPPRTIVVEGLAGCLGDSGGPLMARKTGAALGVYSLLGGAGCLAANARHLFAHVPVFEALISDAFAAAGAKPTPEPSEAASGAGAGNEAGASGNAAGSPGSVDAGGEGGAPGAGGSIASGGVGGTSAGAGAAGENQGPGGTTSAPTPRRSAPPKRSGGGCGLALGGDGAGGSPLVLLALLAALVLARRERRPR